MSADNETIIIKQYQPLIRALIPYEQQNKLLEGLNKFSKRLPSHIRKVVKEEVIRLTSLTDAPADNSAFAQFPVIKFKHFGIQMRLDRVGAQILKQETAHYQDRYTVGVFESVMNSEYYQSHIKKENFKKIVDAFTVETQSLTDIEFGDDIALAPNFPVSSLEFEKGRNCNISALSFNAMSVETRRPPGVQTGETITFTFPEVRGFTQKETQITFLLEAIKFNKDLNKYESHFSLAPDNDDKIPEAIRRYIENNAYNQPLKRDLEIERAMQDLERDRILENSPWVPIYCREQNLDYEPVISLLTKSNAEYNDTQLFLHRIAGKTIFNSVMQEVTQFGEAYAFMGKIKTKKGDIEIAATHRQLMEAGQLSAFVYLLNKSGEYSCMQCRSSVLSDEDKAKAFAIHDLSAGDYQNLASLTHVLFCKDITAQIKPLTLGEKCEFKPIQKRFLNNNDHWPMDYVMEEELDRRSESRYLIDKKATVKFGLLSSVTATVNDISSKGMKMTFAGVVETPMPQEIRVFVPDLKIRNEKYRVVSFDAERNLVRLCLPEVKKRVKGNSSVDVALEDNTAYFKQRDIARVQRNTHRFIWELAIRHMPSAGVLCVNNRYVMDRLKTVYQGDSSDDLYPFTRVRNVVPLHGFFADKEESRPKSLLLTQLFNQEKQHELVVHCVRKADNRLVYIKERDYLFTTLRNQIFNHLNENKIELCVADIHARRCQSAVTPLTKKRLAQLSKLDKAMYDKLNAMQDGYTHIIYITNTSALHNDLIQCKLKPVRPISEDNERSGAA